MEFDEIKNIGLLIYDRDGVEEEGGDASNEGGNGGGALDPDPQTESMCAFRTLSITICNDIWGHRRMMLTMVTVDATEDAGGVMKVRWSSCVKVGEDGGAVVGRRR
ncbi:hypothetical protein L2E82_09026 [Cichorium intybus]|uniref:Uncharacterized protein n=1 Tax=Cichorium intybus TaxID=13427 RepID=A0ACB9G7D3_CICIN|nr:hypothetical protein L2E82_09026 [Cichorium intybus]